MKNYAKFARITVICSKGHEIELIGLGSGSPYCHYFTGYDDSPGWLYFWCTQCKKGKGVWDKIDLEDK